MSYSVTRLEEKALAPFRTLKQRPSEGVGRSQNFVVENPKVVEKVLRSRVEIGRFYATPEYFASFEELLAQHHSHIHVHIAQKQEMESVVGYGLHQGVMLLAEVPEPDPLDGIRSRENCTLLVLEGIADAENMGSLIRNAAALGAEAVIVDSTCCDPWLRRSVRVSMGTAIDIPIYRESGIAEILSDLNTSDISIIATVVDGQPLGEFRFPKRKALLLGSEGSGISLEALSLADYKVGIPIISTVDSLNVAAASGIFLWEAVTQAGKRSSLRSVTG